MNFFKINRKPALFALLCVYSNLGCYSLMMKFDHGETRSVFIFFRILLMISVIMQILIVLDLGKISKK